MSLGLSIAALSGTAFATDASWSAALSGTTTTWNTATNWTVTSGADLYPTGTDAVATFNGDFTGAIVETGNNTVGTINFTDTNRGTGSGLSLRTGTLTFATSSGTPSINIVAGSALCSIGYGNAGDLAIAGSQGLTINSDSNGSLRFGQNGGSSVTWAGFTGALTLNGGSYAPQKANQLPQAAGSYVVLGANTSIGWMNGRDQSIVGLEGPSTATVNQGNGNLTLGTNSVAGESHTFLGAVNMGTVYNMGALAKSGAGTQILSGVVSGNYGSGNAVTLSSGTLQLGGANTYVGPTAINGGTMVLGNATALGLSGTAGANITTTAASTAATVDSTAGLAIGQAVTGTGIAANTYITTISGNTVTLSVAATATGTVPGTFTNGITNLGAAMLDLNGQTISETLQMTSASAVLANNSATQAVVNSAQTGLSNGFTVAGTGDIRLANTWSASGGRTVTMNGTGALTFGGTASNNNVGVTLNSGTLVLAKSGNAFAVSDVTINGGTLKMDPNNISTNSNAWQGQIGNTLTMNGGVWDLNDTAGVNNRLKRINGSAGTITNNGTGAALLAFGFRDGATADFSGTITDGPNGGTVAIVGNGTGAGDGTQTLSGNNSYSGGTTLNSGAFKMGHNNAFGTGSVASKSTIDLNGFALGNALTSPGNGAVFTNTSANTASVTQGFNAAHANGVVISDFTVSGTAGAINWTGDIYRTSFAGTITKSGSNTVTFGGQVNNMGLNLTGGSAIISGTVGGSVAFTGSAGTTLTVSGKLDGTDTTTVNGSASFLNGSTYKFDLAGNGVNDKIVGTGTVSLDGAFEFGLGSATVASGNSWQIVANSTLSATYGATFAVTGFSDIGNNQWQLLSGNNQWTFDKGTGALSVLVVPEPSSALMLLGGMGTLRLLRRRRK